MVYQISLEEYKEKKTYSLGEDFSGRSPSGEEIGFTNYYMERNGKPFFGVSGEFHFSRCEPCRWEDEILKMKMGGLNVVSTYVFWNHHEEEEGVFDFSGRRDLRRFVTLCRDHGMYVILRIGPFDHGEARNGGLPDWLYGKPFEARSLDEGFLACVRRLYEAIGRQIEGLLYKEGGPIIAAQIDNEYMHSSAPWELTAGVTNEWVFGGNEGEAYMLALKDLARACGVDVPFYTCTGWGGAITPSSMLPLWGGYAYRPWLFLEGRGEHPVTEEYLYQDYHNNEAVVTSDFQPAYQPESRPYACCEMGGGMMCTYNYRFAFPYESVDAMANIKLASGCNFLGYYMFQGGTNPRGKHGGFLNEGQVPKLSYDYQAALGEYGQVRPSYRRMKTIHQFCQAFGEELCRMGTALPKGASQIDPGDLETLRFAVRTDGRRGFLFLNNFQDHVENLPKREECVEIQLSGERLLFDHLGLEPGENCILPFYMDLSGILLKMATVQPVTRLELSGRRVYVFFRPEGMTGRLVFKEKARIHGQETWEYVCDQEARGEYLLVEQGEKEIGILVVDRELAGQMYILRDSTLLFTEGGLMETKEGLKLETSRPAEDFRTWPRGRFSPGQEAEKMGEEGIFDLWRTAGRKKEIPVTWTQVSPFRYTLSLPEGFMEGVKEVLLKVDYQGDVGSAFLDGDMVSDHFFNGETWEIGLRTLADRLAVHPLTICLTPLKKGAKVHVESAMAARMEKAESLTALLERVQACPVYEFHLR